MGWKIKKTTSADYPWLCAWNQKEDWPAIRQVPSEVDCKQSYSVPKTLKTENNKRKLENWIDNEDKHITKWSWLRCYLASGRGGAGHGFYLKIK